MASEGAAPILIVDDEEEIRRSVAALLAGFGWPGAVSFPNGADALRWLGDHEARLVILDLNMPLMGGEAVLDWILEKRPGLPVIVVSADADLGRVKACLKKGAYDYFVKPADSTALEAAVRRAAEKRDREMELRLLSEAIMEPGRGGLDAFSEIVTNSPVMISLFRYAAAVAKSPEPVLIMGESGTGKELFAKAIHGASGLKGPFVTVNLAGLDDSFFSDTLFGHRKGAYTGANEAREGLAERSRDGVLFLDEIGDLRPESQVKLLRFLQEGEYYRLGSDAPLSLRVKVAAATNRDLESLVREGRFRLDLFYRLSAHRIRLPALRERPEDIPLLASRFLEEAGTHLGKPPAVLEASALEALSSYGFPGNVRELRSLLIDAAYASESGTIGAGLLSERLPCAADPRALHSVGRRPERTVLFPGPLPSLTEAAELLVDEALRRSGGNQSRAAALIGISHQALSKRLKNREETDLENGN
jgi:DNA-binding NtrC family response regulator